MRSVFLLFFAFFLANLNGQIYLGDGSIRRLNPYTGNVVMVCKLQDQVILTDIALAPNGKMYGVGYSNGTGIGQTLYEIDTISGKSTPIYAFKVGFNGLVASTTGILYLAGEHLATYDPATKVAEDLGKLKYACAGDLLFWGDTLLMSSFYDGLVVVDIGNPGNSSSFLYLDQFYLGIGAAWNCLTGKYQVYLMGSTGKVINLDFPNRRLEVSTRLKTVAGGATSPDEFRPPFPPALDSVRVVSAACGQANGTIQVGNKSNTPLDTAIQFSLDAVHWQEKGFFSGLKSGTYDVYARNSCGEAVFTAMVQEVKTLECLPLPNAFTPNGDGINDTFGLLEQDAAAFPCELCVYNRWGEQVFHSSPGQPRWDGRLPSGEEAPSDVYLYWMLSLKDSVVLGRRHGEVALLR